MHVFEPEIAVLGVKNVLLEFFTVTYMDAKNVNAKTTLCNSCLFRFVVHFPTLYGFIDYVSSWPLFLWNKLVASSLRTELQTYPSILTIKYKLDAILE